MNSVNCWIDDIESERLGIMSRPRGGDWLEDEIEEILDRKPDRV